MQVVEAQPFPAEAYPEYNGPDLVELSTPVDEDAWRYSRFALPWLIWCFLWLLALFCLTFWQQCGNIKKLGDGTARMMRLKQADNNMEAGQTKNLRNLRIAANWLAFFGCGGAIAVFVARPAQGARKGLNFLCALLMFLGAVLIWIAFGVGLANFNNQEQCVYSRRFTFQKCLKHAGYAQAEVAIDAGLGIGLLVSALLVAYNTKANHWKLAPRDWEEAQAETTEEIKERMPGEMVQRNVSLVRKWLTGIALVCTLAAMAANLVFLILLHEDREKQVVLGSRGRAQVLRSGEIDSYDFERAGWRTKNTRIRYSLVGIGLLSILFNFLPFRSRTIAYCFGFIYFACTILAFSAFGFDVHELDRANKLACPKSVDGLEMDCTERGSFVATAAVDFIVGIFLFIYLVVEYVLNQSRQCQHCDRAYVLDELIKHETSDCLQRPVRCEICAKRMTFGQFDSHKQFCSVDHVRCKNCNTMVAKWQVKAHQEECARWPVQCTMCEEHFQRTDMPQHVMVCPNSPTSCDACGETFRSRDIEAHRAVCGEVLVQCTMCDDHMQRFRLSQHAQHDCPRRLLQCERCRSMVPLFRWERHQATGCQ